MGHYASELKDDDKFTPLYYEWKRDWPELSQRVGLIPLSQLYLKDLNDVFRVVNFGDLPEQHGHWSSPTYCAPKGYAAARDAARRLLGAA